MCMTPMVGLWPSVSISKQVGVSAVVFQCLFSELQQFIMEGKTTQVQMELLHQIDEAITGEGGPWVCVLDCARQLLLTDIGLTILRTQRIWMWQLGLIRAVEAFEEVDGDGRPHDIFGAPLKWSKFLALRIAYGSRPPK